jgi:hypothetical protein
MLLNLPHTYPGNTNIQEMARCSVTDSNNDQLYKKPECHEEKGKINAHFMYMLLCLPLTIPFPLDDWPCLKNSFLYFFLLHRYYLVIVVPYPCTD